MFRVATNQALNPARRGADPARAGRGQRWTLMALLALLSLMVSRPADALIISEIQYHSAAFVDGPDEFIELYNENLDPIDLSGYSICDGVDFVFPPGTWLEGRSFLVVCADANRIRSIYGIENVIGNWIGSLSNGGERVRICSTGGAHVAEVSFNDRGKWPGGADGTGHSLELKSPFIDIDDADSWRLSGERGGSPGEPNGSRFATGGAEPPVGGLDSQGFVLEWLVLGPYNGSGCNVGAGVVAADWLREAGAGTARQTGLVWRDGQVVNTSYGAAQSTGLHPNAGTALPTVREYRSFADTIDFDAAVWPPNPEQVMGYAFVYVDNVTGSARNVDIAVASDDGIHVLVNGVSRHVNDVCRGVGATGSIQDRFSATLNAGKNLIAVKVFEQGGGWSFRLRFEEAGTMNPITSKSIIQVTTDVDAGLGFDGSGTPIEDPGEGPPPPPDPGQDPAASPVILNEGLFLTAGERWIEIYNRGATTYTLGGHHLTDDPANLTKATIPAGHTIPSGGYRTYTDTELGLDFSISELRPRVFVALVDASGDKVLDAFNFEPEFLEFSESRVPDGDSEFEGASDPTRGAANSMTVDQQIVINEIQYHSIDEDERKEFVELYHRGSTVVDLTGWELTRGFNFVFPDGFSMTPGEYAVIARDPGLVESIHGLAAGTVLGPEQDEESLSRFGRLRDQGERITLKDHLGRTVDTVSYRDGGEWARWADGFGSTLELIDPYQDNRFAQAWDASDDSDKSVESRHSYIGRHGGGESELHLVMTTGGIAILDDISIIGGGVQNTDVPFIEVGDVWRFFRGRTAPPAGWSARTFNDSTWETGPTGIGYGDGDDATVLDDMSGSYVTIFCRRSFNLTSTQLANIDDLILSVVVDDGFIAYLNGSEVARYNVNGANFDDDASSAGEPNLQERTIDAGLLRVGENVLAVQVHNAGLGSSDLSFIPRLVSRTTEIVDGAEQLTNGHFDSNAAGWIIEGTHVRSGRTSIGALRGNGSLKVIASSRGDNKVNRIETPEANGFGLANLTTGEDLQISFLAKWIIGAPRIITHGYEHAMARSHELAVPENLGSPGRINSVTLRQITATGAANLGPVIDDIFQVPPVPGANEDVTVYAHVSDADGISNVRLRYSFNNPSASPTSRVMSHRGGGVYSATIPGQALGTKVVFHVTATDSTGRTGRYPVDITERSHPLLINPAVASLDDQRHLVYRHDIALPSTQYHSYRFWMTDSDQATLTSRRRLSNDRLPGTFIYGSSDVYYEAHTRFAGSPFARGGNGGSYRVAMPRDESLHGRFRKFTLDNRHGNGTNARERHSHYLVRNNQGAISVPYQDTLTLVRWQMNDLTTQNIEHVWTPDAQFLSRWYPNDDNGDLFEVDDRFVINDNGDRIGNTNATVRYPPNSPRSDGNGENKENYRWFFNLRQKNGLDDYSKLIAMARVMDPSVTGNAQFDEQIWDLVDVEQMLRVFTIRQSTDDWDTWGGNRGKNCYLYSGDNDPRFRLFLQDAELTYGSTTSFLIPDNPSQAFNPGGFGEVHRMLNRPKIKRMYYAILDKMVNGPDAFFTSDHLAAYCTRLAAIGMANTQIGMPGQFVDQRAALVRPRLGSMVTTSFRISTNNGQNFTTTDNTETLAGDAPAAVCQVLVNGEALEIEFTNITTWRIDDVPTPPGVNEIQILAFDLEGELVGSDTITITNTNVAWDPPVISALGPASGLPGGTIEILGSDLHNGVRVFFGAVASPRVVYDENGPTPDRLTAEIPAGSGVVNVTVRNIDGQTSNGLAFTFEVPPPRFLRGDTNGDRRVDVSDGVATLRHLFGGLAIDCQDAADADDDEALRITDAVYTLDFLFRGGPAPRAPWPLVGEDPSGTALGCDR